MIDEVVGMNNTGEDGGAYIQRGFTTCDLCANLFSVSDLPAVVTGPYGTSGIVPPKQGLFNTVTLLNDDQRAATAHAGACQIKFRINCCN